jgi:hypothetical protein
VFLSASCDVIILKTIGVESLENNIKDVAVIVSGAITAFSTLSAVLITNYFNYRSLKTNLELTKEQNKVELKRQKIEDLYLLFEKWQANLSSVYLLHLRVFYNKLTLEQAQELTRKLNILETGDFQKITMLLNIHFHELLVLYKSVNIARKELVPFLSDPKETRLTAQSFIDKQEGFEDQCRIFKEKMSQLANRL